MSFPGSCGLLQGSTPFTASSTFGSTAGTMIPASDTLRTGAPPRPGIPRGIVCTARVGPLDHTEAGLVAHGSRSWTECRDRPPRAVGARIDGRDGCRWATRIPRSLAPLSRSGATLTEPGRCRPGCTVQGPGTGNPYVSNRSDRRLRGGRETGSRVGSRDRDHASGCGTGGGCRPQARCFRGRVSSLRRRLRNPSRAGFTPVRRERSGPRPSRPGRSAGHCDSQLAGHAAARSADPVDSPVRVRSGVASSPPEWQAKDQVRVEFDAAVRSRQRRSSARECQCNERAHRRLRFWISPARQPMRPFPGAAESCLPASAAGRGPGTQCRRGRNQRHSSPAGWYGGMSRSTPRRGRCSSCAS